VVDRAPNGTPLRVVGMVTDMTRIKAAEAAAKDAEQKWKDLYLQLAERNEQLDAALKESEVAAKVKSEVKIILSTIYVLVIINNCYYDYDVMLTYPNVYMYIYILLVSFNNVS